MKKDEVQLPDELYQQIERLAGHLHLTVPDLLLRCAEQMLHSQTRSEPKKTGNWCFPKGLRLGPFLAPDGEWRLLANETAS